MMAGGEGQLPVLLQLLRAVGADPELR